VLLLEAFVICTDFLLLHVRHPQALDESFIGVYPSFSSCPLLLSFFQRSPVDFISFALKGIEFGH